MFFHSYTSSLYSYLILLNLVKVHFIPNHKIYNDCLFISLLSKFIWHPKCCKLCNFNIQLLMYVTMFFVVDIITFFIRTHAKDYLLVQKIARHLFLFSVTFLCLKTLTKYLLWYNISTNNRFYPNQLHTKSKNIKMYVMKFNNI